MPFQGGPKEAAKMLQALGASERRKILEQIAQQDPAMAETLKSMMVSLEDLQHLTVKMLQELLKEVSLKDLGLALRLASEELRIKILSQVSKGMKAELEDSLKGAPRPVSEVQQAEQRVMEVVRRKWERGEIILKDDDTLV